jgi:hypothetical protein
MSIKDRYMLSRMLRDIKVNLIDFFGVFRRQPRPDPDYLLLISGLLYGAVRWMLTEARRSAK